MRYAAQSLVVLLAVAAPWAGPDCRAGEGARNDKVFVGYVYGRPHDVNFTLYTHLCHAFLLPDAEGRLARSHGVPDRAFTAEAHKAGVKVLVSLGGWGYDEQFRAIAAEAGLEERFIGEVMKVVDAADYDGIDVDWEYPDTKAEAAGFARLTRRFRQELDALGKRKGRQLLQTMAASSNAGTLSWLDPRALAETMDWINVMTYDFAGDWTSYAGHHSPLFASPRQPEGHKASSADTIAYLLEDRRIPPDRLALGIPLYGRGFAVADPYAATKGRPKARLAETGYNHLYRLLKSEGWVRSWDDATKTPWLTAPDRSTVIGYDDPESAAGKTEWAMKKGLRVVFFWQVAGDRLPDGTNPVQEASHRAWERTSRERTPGR